MATLNVSFVLDDPRFQQAFNVRRTSQGVGNDGLSITTVTTLNLKGVINIGTIDPLLLTDDRGQTKKGIIVHCRQKLYDVVVGYEPDIVIFNGNNYLVKKVYDWSNYGPGYYAADCEIQDLETVP